MDITITNYHGYTTVTIQGREVHYKQKREDFLKEDFNVILKSIYQKNNIVTNITHDKNVLKPTKQIGIYKWQQGTRATIEKSGDYYDER